MLAKWRGFCLKWPFFNRRCGNNLSPAATLLSSPRASNLLVFRVFIAEEFVKQGFWFLCASIVPVLIGGSLASVSAQTSSPTPDPFTSRSPQLPSPSFNTQHRRHDRQRTVRCFRFEWRRIDRKNSDAKQRRRQSRDLPARLRPTSHLPDHQHEKRSESDADTESNANAKSDTNTESGRVQLPPTPTPSGPTQLKIEIDNRSPMISLAPVLVGGVRSTSSFSARTLRIPGNFDGTEGTLAQDANSEIWIYRVPAVAVCGSDTRHGSAASGSGTAGTFLQVTNTGASRCPRRVQRTDGPFFYFADDNRETTITDDGTIIAFISTRRSCSGCRQRRCESRTVFLQRRATTFTQATNTQDASPGLG